MAFDASQWMSPTGYEIDQSLRFNDSDSAYLSRTPTSASNRRTWTWSSWVKRGNLVQSGQPVMFGAGTSGNAFSMFYFNKNTSSLQFYDYDGTTDYGWETVPLFRDPSAWYHIMCVYDSTDSTAADRLKIYVNNVQYTARGTDYGNFPENYETHINATSEHTIGKYPGTAQYYSGYLGEVNFIDGLALAPSAFGETSTYGEWKPIEYAGAYGTNGFYLPFKQDYTVEGFSTVLYRGTSALQYIGGVGFQSDFTWMKARDLDETHIIVDAVRGINKKLYVTSTADEATDANQITSFSTDGFGLGTDSAGQVNLNNKSYVAWNWDMGGSNANNTTGDEDSVVRANTTYGQSIVSWEATGSATTVGHGLSSAPEFMIIKSRDQDGTNWMVYYGDNTDYLKLNSAAAAIDAVELWNDTSPTASVFSLGGNGGDSNNTNGGSMIAYCFHSVTGYSKFGTYTGNGNTTGPSVTTGFKPAFLMLKRSNNTGGWNILDNTRNPTNPANLRLEADNVAVEGESTAYNVDFNADSFQLKTSNAEWNGNNDTYVYMAFADKREFAYWLDQSGNNNDWTNYNLTESDISVDSPTNNFATLNPLQPDRTTVGATRTFSEGNLKITTTGTSGADARVFGTMGMSSGKWYFEWIMTVDAGGVGSAIGVADEDHSDEMAYYGPHGGGTGGKHFDGGSAGYGATWGIGDIIGVAFNADDNAITFYKNGSGQGEITSAVDGGQDYFPFVWDGSGTPTITGVANFGQDSSFAGNKTAQGNQDSGGIGDFFYTPPSGFLALCSENLPEPAVIPSEYFNTVLWTGDGSEEVVTGVGFQPDWIWVKARNAAVNHKVFDAVRGLGSLRPNTTGAEDTNTSENLTSYDSDGFTMKDPDHIVDNRTVVAWNWKAGNATLASNAFTQGSLASTCSRSVEAGFSIVSYTGNATSGATVGHGLSSAPDMVMVKRRSNTGHWEVYHSKNTAAPETDHLRLSADAATGDDSAYWNDTAPTSSVFSLGNHVSTNENGQTYIAYCFHSVEGYSKFGTYTGNANANGTFVYTGFRPAFVMGKCTSAASEWKMYDSKRNTYNVMDEEIRANRVLAASVHSNNYLDFLSNGFKPRFSDHVNQAQTYIYIAFAKTPFKYSNAR